MLQPGSRPLSKPESPDMASDHEFVDLTLPMLPDMELTAVQTAETLGILMEFDREKIDPTGATITMARYSQP